MVVCRSQQQIDDDRLCELHDHVQSVLRSAIPGRGYLYTGVKRAHLVLLRQDIEAAILGEPYNEWAFRRRLAASL